MARARSADMSPPVRSGPAAWAALAAGIGLVLATGVSLAKTVIVPRPLRSRLAGAVEGAVNRAFLRAAGLLQGYDRKDALLEGRAGAPACGPEILARHQMTGLTGALPAFYERWEEWAADVAESHTNYPVLIHFCSPHPLRSWVVGLLAVRGARTHLPGLQIVPQRPPDRQPAPPYSRADRA